MRQEFFYSTKKDMNHHQNQQQRRRRLLPNIIPSCCSTTTTKSLWIVTSLLLAIFIELSRRHHNHRILLILWDDDNKAGNDSATQLLRLQPKTTTRDDDDNKVATDAISSSDDYHHHHHPYDDQVEAVKVVPPYYTREESFGACLLIMDQNHRFTEWIAYHYFALPLRSLIIAYDSLSTIRPAEMNLLDRWKDVIQIIEWEDIDYLDSNWDIHLREEKDIHGVDGTPLNSQRHINRQPKFMRHCTLKLKEMNVSRILHSDIDEYIRISNYNNNCDDEINPSTGDNSSFGIDMIRVDPTQPGHVTTFLNAIEEQSRTNSASRTTESSKCEELCTLYPRITYTTTESDPSLVNKDIGHLFLLDKDNDPMNFDTLRFRYRNSQYDKYPKAILNCPQLITEEIADHVNWGNHRPLGFGRCKEESWSQEQKVSLVLNHYVGSWESFQFASRYDARYWDEEHTKMSWEMKNWVNVKYSNEQKSEHVDDSIRQWIPSFFQWQSPPTARYLLRHAGMGVYGIGSPE